MSALRVLFADQLSRSITALAGIDRSTDIVLMAEVAAETDHVPHHRKKIAFLFAAMRHFAHDLRGEGIRVDYVRLDDPVNGGSLRAEVLRALKRHQIDRIIVTEPGEWRVLDDMRGWAEAAGCTVEIRADERFYCSLEEFRTWSKERRQLRMEYFYRDMRRRTGLLMDGPDDPAGGHWNFDAENRKGPPRDVTYPAPRRFAPDAVTEEVLSLVQRHFPDRYGDLDPFWFAVTALDARRALEHFVEHALPHFGDYQDAMQAGEDWLFHAALSQYLNCGLLLPMEICAAVEAAWRAGSVPLNCAEGFIRQILGWREYVRGIYWLKMPGYAGLNALEAVRPLPAFYWTCDTDMRCMAHALDQTRREALSHHIQRLMVTGNFALLAGVLPEQICAWYLAVYADAYEWVELPNTLGMAMYADGGLLGSKPYAASGAYIDRMSDFCDGCHYDVRLKNGPGACPFNFLYWDFLIRNRPKLGNNHRLVQIYRNLDRFSAERLRAIREDAERFLGAIEPWMADDHAA